MQVENILFAGQVAAAISALFILGGIVIRWFVVPPLEKMINEKTAPIQPNANGGKSLPDVAIMLGRLSQQIDHMDKRLGVVEAKICSEK
jgi:hypothetical protein